MRRPRRRLLRRREHAPGCCSRRRTTSTQRAGERLRPGRAQLHVPQQPGRARALQGREPDDLSEDARGQRLLLRERGLRVPDGQHPDGRQVTGRRCSAARSRRDQTCPDWPLRGRRRARGRLLALDRGPSAGREPRHGRPRTATFTIAYTPSNDEPKDRLFDQLQVDARRPRHAPRTCSPTTPISRTRSRSPASPTRPAPAGSGRTRAPRRSTPTARPTSSTTCTSSTRASSRVSVPSTRR